MNVITHFAHRESEFQTAIAEALKPYRDHGLASWWIVPDGAASLEPAIKEQGFHLEHEEYGLFIDPRSAAIDSPEGTSVEELSEENFNDFISVSFRSARDPERVKAYFCQAVEREEGRLKFFLARWKGEPAGTGLLHVLGDFGNLGSGFVNEAYRRKGVYRSLVAHRLKVLKEKHVASAVVLSKQQTSGPILLKLGFEIVTRFKVFERPAASR